MRFREALRLVSTTSLVAAYPDGTLSLVKVGLDYRLCWEYSFMARSKHIDASWVEPTDDRKGMRLTLLGQLFAEWHFVEHYVPTVAEWAEYVRYMFNLHTEQTKCLELSSTVFNTYTSAISNVGQVRDVLRKYIYTRNFILDVRGKS